jgi:hypothetical protein
VGAAVGVSDGSSVGKSVGAAVGARDGVPEDVGGIGARLGEKVVQLSLSSVRSAEDDDILIQMHASARLDT